MGRYRRILLAVDLTDECRQVAERARTLADASEAQLHIVHVIEPLVLAYGGEVPMDLSAVQDQIEEQAHAALDEFAHSLGVPAACRHLVFGRPESEIHRLAEAESMDLIVVGSHGRHGLALLLGSTANGVLHGASCDVLAVRVGTGAARPARARSSLLRKLRSGENNSLARGAVAAAALFLAAFHATPPTHAAELSAYEQRLAYQRAVYAIRTGRSGEFRREQARLKDYALRPYLAYHDAMRRISSLSAKQARQVRATLDDTPLAPIFYRGWLQAQARRGRWETYLANYEPSDDAAARCNYLRALYRSGKRAEALDRVRDLWVAPRSQPKTCDPLFEVWIASGRLDQEAVWARLALALDAGEVTLARYLLRFFNAGNAAAGRLYYDAHVRPRTVRSLSRFKDTAGGRRALRHGLLRYARQDAESALALWTRVGPKRGFNDADRNYIAEHLAVALAETGTAPNAAPTGFSPESMERIALAMVRHRQWTAAATWIQALPPDVATKPRWRYWLGRALMGTDAEDAAREHLEAVAGLRTYYGFLAAEELGRTPALNAVEPRHDPQAREALLAVPAVRRMTELFAVGDLVNARREWRHALPLLDEAARRDLVELTAAIGWGEQAIFGARDGEMADLIAIRFPRPHEHIFRRNAFHSQLPAHFLFAIARQESAFNPRAISSAGARGLMQLMPGTARLIADRVRTKRPSREELLNPDVNVRLATHHLARLMRRYGGNRALVAAAYNAGEQRVARWLKNADGMPTPVWVERIPFRETRDYVKAVIAFAHVYARLAGIQPAVLAKHERTIAPP